MQGLYLHRTAQYRKTRIYIHASSEIRSHDPSIRAAEDSTCLRKRGHWDRLHNRIYSQVKGSENGISQRLKYFCTDNRNKKEELHGKRLPVSFTKKNVYTKKN
jgi:hypothetical protein